MVKLSVPWGDSPSASVAPVAMVAAGSRLWAGESGVSGLRVVDWMRTATRKEAANTARLPSKERWEALQPGRFRLR